MWHTIWYYPDSFIPRCKISKDDSSVHQPPPQAASHYNPALLYLQINIFSSFELNCLFSSSDVYVYFRADADEWFSEAFVTRGSTWLSNCVRPGPPRRKFQQGSQTVIKFIHLCPFSATRRHKHSRQQCQCGFPIKPGKSRRKEEREGEREGSKKSLNYRPWAKLIVLRSKGSLRPNFIFNLLCIQEENHISECQRCALTFASVFIYILTLTQKQKSFRRRSASPHTV